MKYDGQVVRTGCLDDPAAKADFCSHCDGMKICVEPDKFKKIKTTWTRSKTASLAELAKCLPTNTLLIKSILSDRTANVNQETNKLEREFQLEYLGTNETVWVFESQLPNSLIDEYDNGYGEALWEDFLNDDEDMSEVLADGIEELRQQLQCKTDKEKVEDKSKIKRHKRTQGIQAAVLENGVIAFWYENYRSESKAALWIKRIQLMKRFPDVDYNKLIAGYDDTCHWDQYCKNEKRRNTSPEAETLAMLRKVIDRFHLRNHTACGNDYNPSQYEEMNDIETQMVERTWTWLKPFSKITRQMGGPIFVVFILCMFTEYNVQKLKLMKK